MKPSSLSATAVLLLALSACSGNTVKETLGIDRSAPDEFRVVSRPPLSVPPEFSLRPPMVSGDVPASANTTRQAESIVLGDEAAAQSKPLPVEPKSSAEAQLLRNAGADQSDPNVRRALVEEKIIKEQAREDESWWQTMSILPDKKEPLVDAKAESSRIKKNEEEGKPVTEGETPQTKERDTGVLGRILGY